jgi:NitT/TauT family transport system substrate-binding protein
MGKPFLFVKKSGIISCLESSNSYRRQMRLRAIIISCLFMVSLLLFGCSPKGSGSPVDVHVATLRGSSALSLLRMIDSGVQIEGAGLTSYEIAGSPDQAVAKILSKEVDIATIPANVAAKLFNRGVDYRIGAVTGWGVLYILSSDDSIAKVGDLQGKTIHTISRGSTPDILLRYVLDINGLKEGDYGIDYSLEQIELTQMLIAGRVDLAMLPEPFVTKALMQNSDLGILADIQEQWQSLHGGGLPQTCIYISADLIDNNPEIVDNFLKEAEESILWVNSNIEEAAALAEKYDLGLDRAEAMESIPRSNIIYRDTAHSLKSLEEYFNVIYGFSPEDIGGKVPSEDLYYIKK